LDIFFFSYRSHPSNVGCLTTANIHHVSLGNNHTLDFEIKGLEETCETLDKSGISYVGQSFYSIILTGFRFVFLGAGKTRSDALGPVYLDIPLTSENAKPVSVNPTVPRSSKSLRVGFLSLSDHPSDWRSVPSFHLLPHYDLSKLSAHLGPLIATARSNSDLVIFSIHWGPNYQWIPDKKIQELGRWLIHEGVDVIHGHSSHHIQGIEIVERRNGSFGLILYGCGDFVDDYAVDEQYRNDLGALFQLNISISEVTKSIQLHSLSIFPTRCSNFQVNRLNFEDNDWKWIKDKFIQLSHIGNRTWKIGQNSQLSIDI
jgi:poly-gamma-glutamate capsule biosynthesis protein CapA/YwtB (metallophosphatase superfamily)